MRTTSRSRCPPKLSAMAAVKYAPPAMPPRKKYQTISMCQSGGLSMAVPLSAPLAERHDGRHADQEGRPDGEHGVGQHVALGQLGLVRQIVGGRLVEQQEEGIEPAQGPLAVGAVEMGACEALLFELGDPLLGLGDQLVAEAELDRVGRAGL